MAKQTALILILFIAGVLSGMAIMLFNEPETLDQGRPGSPQLPASNPFATIEEQPADARIRQLEQKLYTLNSRIEALESAMDDMSAGSTEVIDAKESESIQADGTEQAEAAPPGRILTVEGLVSAGIDEVLAASILRRRNQVELARLQLRDRASREGYLGTSRYRAELMSLNANDVSLRDEIGDAAYDRYLFASGQNNRVRVASVMMGSAAEQSGIETGDLILKYDGQTVFRWDEVQRATSGGELGEYVSLDILRDGVRLNLWVPRGPLGVRLDATRLDPGG